MTRTKPVPWLHGAEIDAWRAFVETTPILMDALDADLRAAHGLSMGDYQVLVYLSEAPGHRLRMCDLAGRLRLSPSGVTRRLNGLVADGLVRRVEPPDDRRVLLAVLTDAGMARLRKAAPSHVASVRERLIDRLGPDLVESFAEAFRRVSHNLEGVPAGACGTAAGSGAEQLQR